MGAPSTASGPVPLRPRNGGRSWLAAVPFAVAWSFAALMLDASLAPATLDEPRLEESPPAPSPPATHHDDIDFDSSELISV